MKPAGLEQNLGVSGRARLPLGLFRDGRFESTRPRRPAPSPSALVQFWRVPRLLIAGARGDGPELHNVRGVKAERPIDLPVATTARWVGPPGHPTRDPASNACARLSIATATSASVDLLPVVAAEKLGTAGLSPAGSVGAGGPRESCTRRFARRGSKKSKLPVQRIAEPTAL